MSHHVKSSSLIEMQNGDFLVYFHIDKFVLHFKHMQNDIFGFYRGILCLFKQLKVTLLKKLFWGMVDTLLVLEIRTAFVISLD